MTGTNLSSTNLTGDFKEATMEVNNMKSFLKTNNVLKATEMTQKEYLQVNVDFHTEKTAALTNIKDFFRLQR